MQQQELNAYKLAAAKMHFECQGIFHAALYPLQYTRREHKQAVRAMALAKDLERAEKILEQQCKEVVEECVMDLVEANENVDIVQSHHNSQN